MNDMHRVVIQFAHYLCKLRQKAKALSEDDFNRMLQDADYTQKIYLIYFRYF